MQIILLTHERELDRATNTGRLALEVCTQDADVSLRRIVWQRTEPDRELQAMLKKPGVGLLYPNSEVQGREVGEAALGGDECETFILLDGTWQEARKIYNRSPYLHSAPRIDLPLDAPSRFTLRRNQREGCLCTAECVMEILQHKGMSETAQRLQQRFTAFLAQ